MDALSTFIQAQRTLLAQTETDIEKLKEIRSQIVRQPEDLNVEYFLNEVSSTIVDTSLLPNFNAQIGNGPTRLSELTDITATGG